MTLIKTSFFSAIESIIKIVSGFIITKIVAVYIGPSGLAIIGHLQNFVNLTLLASGDFFKTAITKYTAQFQNDEIKKYEFWSTSVKLASILYMVIFIFLFFFSDKISLYLFHNNNYSYILKILSFTIPFFILNGIVLAILNGQRQIKQYIVLSISLNIISLVLVGLLSIFFALDGALVAYVINQSVVLIITIFYLRNESWLKLKNFSYKLKQENIKKIFKMGLITFSAIISSNVSFLYIRDYISTSLSMENAGYWQGISMISNSSLSIITTSLTTYLLPTLSCIKEKNIMNKEIKKAICLVLPITSVISLLLYFFRHFIISILYTKDFFPMEELFLWQMIGNIIKSCSWLFGYVFVAKAMIKYFVITEVIFALTMVLFSIYFIDNFAIVGVTYAYAINSFLYFITVVLIYKFKVKDG